MSSVRGDRDVAVQPGHHLDVVDREHVRRVGHRQQQRLVVDITDRDRPIAASRAHGQQVGCPHVDLVDVEVDVVEPVALGDRPGELIGVDHVVVAQAATPGSCRPRAPR